MPALALEAIVETMMLCKQKPYIYNPSGEGGSNWTTALRCAHIATGDLYLNSKQ